MGPQFSAGLSLQTSLIRPNVPYPSKRPLSFQTSLMLPNVLPAQLVPPQPLCALQDVSHPLHRHTHPQAGQGLHIPPKVKGTFSILMYM